MKQVNFSHSGGFPLEQETLERLQTAYRSELYEALKGHLSIKSGVNYIISPATELQKGWAVIHQGEEGILYPIEKAKDTGFLKTTRITTPLIFGDGTAHDAYIDYEAKYISDIDFNKKSTSTNPKELYNYYSLTDFVVVKDIDGILELIEKSIAVLKTTLENSISNVKTILENSIGNVKTTLENSISNVKTTLENSISNVKTTLENSISNVKTNLESSIGNVKTTLENNIGNVKTNLENSIGSVKASCLHINGDNAMLGDLDLGNHLLSKLDIKDTFDVANVRASDFRLGSKNRRGLLHPTDYLGRALVDDSTASNTNLTLNYNSDWQNTYIGGKVYLNNVNTTSSNGSLLVLDNLNQVIKSNTLIDSLLSRITALENNSFLYKGTSIIGDIDSTDKLKTVYLPVSVSTSNYVVLGSLVSHSNFHDGDDGWNWDNDFSYVIVNKNLSWFQIGFREYMPNLQNLTFEYILIAL
jgi:hypothetical protein